MKITGIVEKVIEVKQRNKAVVLVKCMVNEKESWSIDFRQFLRHRALVLIPGDRLVVDCIVQGCIDENNKSHNNIIASSFSRI